MKLLNHLFEVHSICDVSKNALDHVSQKFSIKNTTTNYKDILNDTEVEAIMILCSDHFHSEVAINGLKSNKSVFIEKPMCLTEEEANLIIKAKNDTNGKVFIGYQRRYAAAFEKAKDIIKEMKNINYVRVRDIIGPNDYFVNQSGTNPVKFNDIPQEAKEEFKKRDEQIFDAVISDKDKKHLYPTYRLLGSLGSHDLSAMRELIGEPKSVIASTNKNNFITTFFDYDSFITTLEMGVDDCNGIFDAHIEVYGDGKRVKVQYDTPYIKGLPITLHVQKNIDNEFVDQTYRPTYEDAYTLEYKQFYEYVRNNKLPKTTPEDAKQDLRTFKLIIDKLP